MRKRKHIYLSQITNNKTMEAKLRTIKEVATQHFCKEDIVDGVNLQPALQEGFIAGAKYIAERMYSEEEVETIIQKLMNDVHCGDLCYGDNVIDFKLSPRQWFNQNKK